MDDEQVIEEAAERGLEPVDRVLKGVLVYGWARGDDERWPCFLEQRLAISWMRDRLSRTAVFG